MEIRLHIGAHRTGSTRLQTEFSRRAGHLATRRIGVAGPGQIRPDANIGLTLRAALPGPLAALIPAEVISRIRQQIASADAAGMTRLLLSEEDLAGAIDRILTRAVLYDDIAGRLGHLARPMAGHAVTVLLTIRSYDSYFTSLYAHRTLRRAMPDFATLAPRLAALPRRWPDVVADIARALPEAQVVVMRFEDVVANHHRSLCMVAGQDDLRDWGDDQPPVLPSPSAEAVAVLNTMPASASRAERRAVARAHPRPAHARFDPWEPADRDSLTTRYAEDLRALENAGARVTLADLGQPEQVISRA